MRSSYWSNSKFADKIRVLFGITTLPAAASFDGWKTYRSESKQKSKFGYFLVEKLNTVQNIVMYVPDKIRSLVYYVSNRQNQTHVLKTQTKPGTWSDLVTKIPDALMLSIIDFVEVEAFHMMVCYDSDTTDPVIIAYNNQSYLKRKLFPMKIDSAVRCEYGVQWLNYQIRAFAKNKRDIDRHPYQKLMAAYYFAKYEYFNFDAWKLVDYDFESSKPFETTPEKSEAYKKIAELEKTFDDEVTKHCTNIVKYRDHLWT
jgi:hypothetical protein